jgi:hypothetical protein
MDLFKVTGTNNGDEIDVYDFRSGNTLKATTVDDVVYNDDFDTIEVLIVFKNGDEHYAVWDDKNHRWESGEI